MLSVKLRHGTLSLRICFLLSERTLLDLDEYRIYVYLYTTLSIYIRGNLYENKFMWNETKFI